MEKISIGFLVAAFGCVIAYELFRRSDAMAHAQPARFLVLAISAVLLAFLTTLANDALKEGTPADARDTLQFWSWLATMMNLICGAFAGALASVAITNRAKFMHDNKASKLSDDLDERIKMVRRATRELKFALGERVPHDPYDSIKLQKTKEKLQEVMDRQLDEIAKIEEELDIHRITRDARSTQR